MTSKSEKLLQRMRNSKSNWKRNDLDKLYSGFGFEFSNGSKHDIFKHPSFPHLRRTLPRTNEIAKGYVVKAVKTIDELKRLEESTNEKE